MADVDTKTLPLLERVAFLERELGSVNACKQDVFGNLNGSSRSRGGIESGANTRLIFIAI